jgi:hypothetical protein
MYFTKTKRCCNEILSAEAYWAVTPCRFLNSCQLTESKIPEGLNVQQYRQLEPEI